MARKKKTRPTRRPAKPETPPPETPTFQNILLDWRFNLLVLGCMELLIIGFFLPRELARYRWRTARTAILEQDYGRALRHLRKLARENRMNPNYYKARGDVALGRGQYKLALEYYRVAKQLPPGARNVDLYLALAWRGLARTTKDENKRAQYYKQSRNLLYSAYRSAPRDIRVNYWMGEFALAEGDFLRAAEYFSRVRPEALPRHRKPDPEERRLIQSARDRLDQIRALTLGGSDYRLDVADLEIETLPPLSTAAESPTTPTAPTTSPTPSNP